MKEEIVALLLQRTQQKHSSTLMEVSELIHKSRNFTAKILSELLQQGILVSVAGEKRAFFHKEALEEMYHQTLSQNEFACERLLWDALEKEERKDFEKLVGYEDSLAGCVEMCKAAISYPQNSLPVLLYGCTGTGKSYMAQLMYEYALTQHILTEDMPFVTLNCSEYANNPELLSAHLFGHKKGAFTGADSDNPGLIQAADGGVLFLDEVHCLKAECQEKLFLFMDKGIYHRIGENEKWETSHVRLIFATTETPEKVLLKTFLRRIPMVVSIPSLDERGIHERIALLHLILSQEEKRIHKKICLSNLVYNAFLSYHFEGNIGELKNTILVCCAHALHRTTDEKLEIHMEDFPDKMFDHSRYAQKLNNDSDSRMISVQDLKKGQSESPLLHMFDVLLTQHDGNQSVIACTSYIQEYYEKINFENKSTNKNEFIFENLDVIVKKTFQKYGCKINHNELISLFHYLEDAHRQPMNIHNWCMTRQDKIAHLHLFIQRNIENELSMAEEIMDKIWHQLDMKFAPLCLDILALQIRMYNRDMEMHRRIGIILAHGYSTASSIADAANRLLEDYVFESIDMPIDMDCDKVVEELNSYLHSKNNFEEVVLLVDMGSLEQIYAGIDSNINANIGIINNITTKLALEIGNGLRNDIPLQELLKSASEQNEFHYHVIEKKQKEEVIVCACASGLGTAEKLRNLLITSLPSNSSLHVITYDYHMLMEQKERSELFDKYQVICVIGTLDPLIDSITFIPIEELIVEQDIEKLDHVLKDYISKENIEKFKQDILRNFSLSNVMNFLTILNPNMLLEHVASALDNFQRLYNIRIRNNTCVGLYVHICCMIERLVMRQPLNNYLDIELFNKTQQPFITNIKKAFEDTQNYYGIEIPEDEIGYIYDYIQNEYTNNQDF